jgi:hypothetical protein
MLKKIGGLARALYIVLAIVAGFVAMGMINVGLVLVCLGLLAGLAMPRERMLLVAAIVIVLPTVGAALSTIPMIGAQLTAVAANIQLGAAAALASAIAIFLYELFMDGVQGIVGGMHTRTAATAM